MLIMFYESIKQPRIELVTLNVSDMIITNMLYYLKNVQRSSPFQFHTKQLMINYVAMLFLWSHDVSSVNVIQFVRY